MTRRILQFGTSRFLQAHVDLFVHEARLAGQDIGPICVVQTTEAIQRSGRLVALNRLGGFPVIIRGYRDGRLVEETIQVCSVDRALSAQSDWSELVDLFSHETEIVVSNVSDSGYTVSTEDDNRSRFTTEVPRSFPGMFLNLLLHRYQAGARPLLVLPCELISGNGRLLQRILLDLAARWSAPAGFVDWVQRSVVFCNTLVDRIVSEAIEPIGAVAEPYALWAIQRAPGAYPPFVHPAITMTDDLEPFARLKLHILNLGHTYLAQVWLQQRHPPEQSVKEILNHAAIREQLTSLYVEEIVPGFATHGMAVSAAGYVSQVMGRFDNPFIHHRIADIAQNHPIKIERRITAFIEWVRERAPAMTLPRLSSIAAANGGAVPE